MKLNPGDNIYYCSTRKKWFISLGMVEVNVPYTSQADAEWAYSRHLISNNPEHEEN